MSVEKAEDQWVVTTLRVRKPIHALMSHSCAVLNRSMSSVMEEALLEWFKNHPLESYRLLLTKKEVTLLKIGTDHSIEVMHTQERNGVPPKKLAEEFSRKVGSQVQLVIKE